MSKIEELIKEKCPDGVEYITLGGATIMQRGTSLTKAKAVEGNIPVISGGKEPAFYCNIANREEPVITVAGSGAGAGYVQYFDSPIFANDCFTLVGKTGVNTKYVYYFMESIQKKIFETKRGAGVPHVHISDVDKFEIPVPPIEVQQEIVRILDKFTELEAELQVELDSRKKQYDEYLNLLMDFSYDNTIKYMSVGELFDIKNGLNKEKDAFGKGKPIINFTDVFKKRYLVNGNFTGLVDVNEEEIERYSAKKGDVFFTRTSETREDVGMSSTLVEDVEGCVFSGFVLRARPMTELLLPKFCAYYFATYNVRKTIIRYASFTTRATTTGPKLSKIMVPILPIKEQQRIVDILDKMDSICNDLKCGLPAEIEARHKQYEYYRDKLLTFERKVV